MGLLQTLKKNSYRTIRTSHVYNYPTSFATITEISHLFCLNEANHLHKDHKDTKDQNFEIIFPQI